MKAKNFNTETIDGYCPKEELTTKQFNKYVRWRKFGETKKMSLELALNNV